MSTNVTPITPAAKRPTRPQKDCSPDVELLTQAADLMAFATKVYEPADFSDLRNAVHISRALVERWAQDNEMVSNFSDELFDALGLLIMADIAFTANLDYQSSQCDPYRATLSVAAGLLRRCVRRPVDD